MNDSPQSPQPDPNLPVPFQQSTAVGRPTGSGRTPPPQSWQTGEPEAVPWGQYFDALRRRWWVVLLVAVAGSYAGRVYSKQVPSFYETSIKIFVSPSGPRGGGGPISAPSVLTVTTLRDMVKTPIVAAPVVRALGLNVHYKRGDAAIFRNFAYDSVFTPGVYRLQVDTSGQGYELTLNPRSESPQREVGALGADSVGRQFGFLWQPPIAALKPKQIVDFSVQNVTLEALALTGQLRTGFDEEGGQILTLFLESSNRETIAPTLNAWAKEFIDYVTEAKRVTLTQQRLVIEQQLTQARGQMDVAQRALQRFREANIFAPTETTVPAGSIALQASQLDQIRSDRSRIRDVIASARRGRVDDVRLYNAPAILNAAGPKLTTALQQLMAAEQAVTTQKQSYADGSPQVLGAIARFRAVNDTLIPAILSEIDSTFADKERALDSEVSQRRGELSAVPRRAFDALELQRNFDEAVQLWTGLNNSFQQVRLLGEQTNADLTIMGEAIPPAAPSSSRGPRIFILAVGASIGAGLALALLLDRLDRRFRYPQQATMELGLTIAGTIPFFKPNRKGELNLSASAQVVESFRTLRLSTQFHFPPGEPVVVCISSPGPGEGKSLVASNLAVAFANAGQKTLLIDGDVRRGVVHTTFETERRPGLVDYLGGTATAAQIIRPTSTDRLFVVSSGSRSRRAPELLTSDRMSALIAETRTQYEVVIIDSAPFVAGMDAFALGVAAGSMLVVLRPGHTDRKLAENKLEIFDRLPVTIIGAVLNAISSGRAYRYYSDYATYEGEQDNLDEADFDPPPTSPTRLIGRRPS